MKRIFNISLSLNNIVHLTLLKNNSAFSKYIFYFNRQFHIRLNKYCWPLKPGKRYTILDLGYYMQKALRYAPKTKHITLVVYFLQYRCKYIYIYKSLERRVFGRKIARRLHWFVQYELYLFGFIC